MKKKQHITIGIILFLVFALWPVKGACGGKGKTCAYLSLDKSDVCVSKQVKPNLASILDIPINYTNSDGCN